MVRPTRTCNTTRAQENGFAPNALRNTEKCEISSSQKKAGANISTTSRTTITTIPSNEDLSNEDLSNEDLSSSFSSIYYS
ncbi:MAG: hypothetical protein ACTSR7_00670 [Promethearchaeota archaeon]